MFDTSPPVDPVPWSWVAPIVGAASAAILYKIVFSLEK